MRISGGAGAPSAPPGYALAQTQRSYIHSFTHTFIIFIHTFISALIHSYIHSLYTSVFDICMLFVGIGDTLVSCTIQVNEKHAQYTIQPSSFQRGTVDFYKCALLFEDKIKSNI
jgi:hypothetical protein